jgi:hypothetical protein
MEGVVLKISRVSIIAIVLVVIAVAIAGCSSTSPTTPATGGTPAATTAAGAPSGTTAAPSGGSVSGGQLFGGTGYNWVEYKMSTGSGSDAMTIYYKYDKQTGKCTMRFEGAKKIEGMPTVMDCSSTGGGKAQSDPNQVNPDVKFVKVGTEVVTVPAGTFTADKYTATYQGVTGTYWFVTGKPLIKMASGDATGSMNMELNGMG